MSVEASIRARYEAKAALRMVRPKLPTWRGQYVDDAADFWPQGVSRGWVTGEERTVRSWRGPSQQCARCSSNTAFAVESIAIGEYLTMQLDIAATPRDDIKAARDHVLQQVTVPCCDKCASALSNAHIERSGSTLVAAYAVILWAQKGLKEQGITQADGIMLRLIIEVLENVTDDRPEVIRAKFSGKP
jgi:hypothetical protein